MRAASFQFLRAEKITPRPAAPARDKVMDYDAMDAGHFAYAQGTG